VIFPRSTADVSAVVRVCTDERIPVVAFGAGTGLEGGAVPTVGGLSLDFSEMSRLLAVHAEDFDVVAQPGLTHRSLNQAIRSAGLFFPVDPGADASLGGMAATRASGTNAVRYGTMRENVLALEVVLPGGKIVRTGRRTRKSSAGYDLTRLFVGSEGTLGIITELTLRVHGLPEAMAAAVCPFATLEGAVRTVIATIQLGVPVARIELLDDVQIDAVNRYSKLQLPVLNTLFIEFHGSALEVEAHAAAVQELAAEWGGGRFEWRTKPEERTELWRARHDVGWACKALRPGSALFSTDVCVPISRLAECILETKEDLGRTSLLAPLVGHVGDGNFHLTILVDPNDEKELAEANALNSRLIRRALALDGTCTGEHGVGIGKRPYLPEEHGEGIELMKLLKGAIDPSGIMNPGKVL
jgi:D-lactate dehydrogenase (cytochrome)